MDIPFRDLQQRAWQTAENQGLHTIPDTLMPREKTLVQLGKMYRAITALTQQVKRQGVPENWEGTLLKTIEEYMVRIGFLHDASLLHPTSMHKDHLFFIDIVKTLILIHTEVDEAIDLLYTYPSETLHEDHVKDAIGAELADGVIRYMDLAQKLGIDLYTHIVVKDSQNQQRPFGYGTPLEHANDTK